MTVPVPPSRVGRRAACQRIGTRIQTGFVTAVTPWRVSAPRDAAIRALSTPDVTVSAKVFATQSPKRVALVNGRRLARLMARHAACASCGTRRGLRSSSTALTRTSSIKREALRLR